MNFKSLDGPDKKEQYQNIEHYQRGGMGDIYLADDISNNKRVAIKIIQVDASNKELFEQEFEIASKLDHSNIIKTFYTGEVTVKGESWFYSVMIFIHDGSFRDFLKSQQSLLPFSTVVDYMLQIANAINYAHNYAIHRDLKPENILMDGGVLKICDFGLSKYINVKTRAQTFKGWGTYPYMAPETWTFDSSSIAMDIYSMGIIFFEILTGELPFKGPNEGDYKDQHLFQNLPEIRIFRSDVPVKLEEMIFKMTSKRKDDRYKSVAEIVNILTSLTNQNSITGQGVNIDLLLKAQQKISETNQQQLKLEREKLAQNLKTNYLTYSINNLFKIYTEHIDKLNIELERKKILYNQSERSLYVSFLNKSFSISFYSDDYISQFLEQKKKRFLDNQKQRFGFIIEEYRKSVVEIDSITLVGKATITNSDLGYNLILKKESEQDLYGIWEAVWFTDSAFNRNYKQGEYAISLPDFFAEYEFGRENVMHVRSMAVHRFDSTVIDKMIEKLFE